MKKIICLPSKVAYLSSITLYLVVMGIVSGCVPQTYSQLKAETKPFQWIGKKNAIDISECVSTAWESLLYPHIFVKPIKNGYRIDNITLNGFILFSADITELDGASKINLWITKQFSLAESMNEAAKKAVVACL
jgi:hypothetical protein